MAARNAVGSGMMRDKSGLAEVPAATVASDALRLLESRKAAGLPANADEFVVILDPVTGRPAKLEHAIVDGRLALCDAVTEPTTATTVTPSPEPAAELGSPTIPPAAASAPVAAAPCPVALVPSAVVPVALSGEAVATPRDTSLTIEPLAAPHKFRKGATPALPSLRAWFRALPRTTRTVFAPNPKRGASFQRYNVYMHASTIDEYRMLNPDSRFTLDDLVHDFTHGYLTLPDLTPMVAAVAMQHSAQEVIPRSSARSISIDLMIIPYGYRAKQA